ncbi:MAG: HAD-IIIA family hydrolase [Bdellovibrionales bacterium]|nr:HAD-IIIA family hydrolase [Bdellovibrionales bacterium]
MADAQLLILDRDGVLNSMVVHPEHGTVDSPMNADEVTVFPWVPRTLRRLQDAGWILTIASNQPAAAYGKTTRVNLEAVHSKILSDAQSAGAVIASSHICFHGKTENCDCRKPKTGLLREALARHGVVRLDRCWMIGDGITDVQAGQSLGLQTAFLGPQKCDHCKIFEERQLRPQFWGANLEAFADFLL